MHLFQAFPSRKAVSMQKLLASASMEQSFVSLSSQEVVLQTYRSHR